MKICIFHGSNRKGNTDKTIELIKMQLNEMGKLDYVDFYLPQDLPHFCTGCMACLRTGSYGGENCPHKAYTHPILKAMLEADGIIIGCPSYALAETAQIKALFDHFACIYIVHRPNPEMFNKVALIMSTAAGAGTGRVVSTISRNLTFWGVKHIDKFKFNMWHANWDEMPKKRKLNIEKKIKRKAKKFYKLTGKRYSIMGNTLGNIIRTVFKYAIKNYSDSEPDKIYWKSKGWI